jgi:hypothetical protein
LGVNLGNIRGFASHFKVCGEVGQGNRGVFSVRIVDKEVFAFPTANGKKKGIEVQEPLRYPSP